MPRFAANLSMLYPELDFLDRFEAAARDGPQADQSDGFHADHCGDHPGPAASRKTRG